MHKCGQCPLELQVSGVLPTLAGLASEICKTLAPCLRALASGCETDLTINLTMSEFYSFKKVTIKLQIL